MSNQNMNPDDVLPADEQSAILTAAVLGHFETKWAELQGIIAQLKEQPEDITLDHVRLVKEAIQSLMRWLRGHGIDAHFEVTTAAGLDVQAGDRL